MFTLLLLACAHPPETEPLRHIPLRVALTFDDLPYQTRRSGPVVKDPAIWAQVNQGVLDALSQRQAPATVFVNCGYLDGQDALVDAWWAAGHGVGNHTAHHKSAEHTPLPDWIADVQACDGLWAQHPEAPRLLRYPYLRQGTTPEAQASIDQALRGAGYTPVPVTVATSEWLLAFYYEEALARGDLALQEEVAQAYTAHMVSTLLEASAVAQEKLGRDVAHISLLHMNRLEGEHLGEALEAMQAAGAEFISLQEALQDPIYAEPPAWAGSGSRSWLEMTAPAERPDGSRWFVGQEEGIEAQFEGRLPLGG